MTNRDIISCELSKWYATDMGLSPEEVQHRSSVNIIIPKLN